MSRFGSSVVGPFTFIPTYALATPGSSGWTYTEQFGRWWRSGPLVFIAVQIQTSAFSVGTGSGVFQLISNLPVNVNASGRVTMTVHLSGWTKVGYTQVTGFATGGDGALSHVVTGTAVATAQLVATELGAGGQRANISGFYEA